MQQERRRRRQRQQQQELRQQMRRQTDRIQRLFFFTGDILPSSNYFVTEDSRLIRKLSQPSATSSGAKHNKRLLSASHSVDSKTVAIGESIISMLIKLHAKFSKNPYKPNPDGAAVDSRIGDGAFFITKVLDKISRNEKCMQYIKTLVTSDEDILGEPKKVPIEEDRRLKAKQRQEKLLNYFASKQQKFLLGNDFIEDAMEDDDKTHDNLLRDNDFMNRVYDCCICNLSTVTSNNRPVCLIAAATPSYVLEHRTMVSPASMEADDDVMQKDSASPYPQASLASSPLPADLLSASPRSSVHLKTSSHSLLSCKSTTSLVVNNEQANSMKYGYCSSVFRQLVDKYKLNDYLVYETPSYYPWYRSLNIQSCGHYLHYDCGLSYIKSLQDRNQSSFNLAISANGDFVCPMCRQVSNIILPLTVPNPLPSSAVEDTTHKIRELLAVSTMETPVCLSVICTC
ncbi:hypothetical protein HELRODRAFT_168086 [Helobdella robusta]|uniref:E3 ubiquitin-protein ligase n=1 Tax=Helobdella robusta TaxID=6412 RepID=T1F056_HELRO|nr:hypothetical protein HELRODRAFT_168086 [Helobdella robusta]ESO10206.1 hypothetical protein HELRODRAFT_168086 [Helobdella robusta]